MTSKLPLTGPVFKTANGDQLLISFGGGVQYLSARQIKCNWKQTEGVDTSFLVTVGKKKFDLTIKHSVQTATAREQTQHRYILRNFPPVFQALKGQPNDIFGIARSSTGTYSIEKNTEEVKAIHGHYFPAKSNGKSTSAAATTSSGAAAAKKRPPPKKKPINTTTTNTTEAYPDYDDDLEVPASERNAKRRRIGGSSGPTRKFISGSSGGVSRQNAQSTERLMVPLTRPTPAPMSLLPEEVPLGVEIFFGEGNAHKNVTSFDELGPASAATAPNVSTAECTVKPPARYTHAVNRAREGMKKKAMAKGGKPLVLRAIKAVELFERICLGDGEIDSTGRSKATAADRREACIEYDAVLRMIYPELIVDAHVLDVKILEEMEGTDELQLLRCMERRFIIWKQQQGTALQPLHHNSQQRRNGRNENRLLALASAASSFKGWISRAYTGNAGVAADQAEQQQQQPPPPQQGGSSGGVNTWGDGLKNIWRVFSSRLGNKTYGGVDLRTTNANVSCALNDTIWWNGQLVRRPVSSKQPVLATIADAIAGNRPGNPRLYLTDGSMPDYEAQNYPRGAPGMPCLVDALSNAMLPHAVRSSRSTNLFHFLKNESTGTGTFTLFGGIGPGANLTAFHFETKRRRSYNCATGDYIFQPLAASANTRAMMRVHAAVAGRHSRHGQLLPLECYLEEGITMVAHLRIDPDPSLCELCEQSMHAFITFDDGTCGGSTTPLDTAAAIPIPTNNTNKAIPTTNKANNTINSGGGGGGSAISKLLFPLPRDKNIPTTTLAPPVVTLLATTSMPLKVSCNDFDLIWDIDATYCMERVSNAYKCMKILPEEAPPSDKADTWIQSSYLTAEPRTMKGLQGGGGGDVIDSLMNGGGGGGGGTSAAPPSVPAAARGGGLRTLRPWACEVTSAARREISSPGWKPDLRGQRNEIGDFELDSGMDVIAVRTAEKLLDVVLQKVTADVAQHWVGEVPTLDEANQALARLIPVLNDMKTRAFSENAEDGGEPLFFLNPLTTPGIATLEDAVTRRWRDKCHFSKEYLEDVLSKISSVGQEGANSTTMINTTAANNMHSAVISHVSPNILYSEDATELGDMPAGVLRKLWMYRLIAERNAVLEEPLNLSKVAEARRRRHAVELAFDIACCELIKRNSSAWGMPADDSEDVVDAEELQHIDIEAL